MAMRSFPHDAVAGDRVLDTQQWARLTSALSADGIVPGLGSSMAVTVTSPESLAVDVSLGDYLIQGRHFQVHSEPQTVTLATAHATNPRIDRIVVRRDMSARTVVVGKITGTAAVSPTPPALTRDAGGVWEDPLRQVYVRANATVIRATDQADGQGYLSTDERVFARSTLGPWGEIGYASNSTAETAVPVSDTVFVTMNVPLRADRRYRLLGHARYRTSTDVERRVRMQILANGSPIASNAVNVRATDTGHTQTITVPRLRWVPGSTATWTIAMTYARVGGSADALHRASSAYPSELSIEDIGAA